MSKRNGKDQPLSRATVEAMTPAEINRRSDEIDEWLAKGQPEPDKRKRPDNYRFSRAEIARMDDEEVAINASGIREAITSGDLL